MGITLDFVCTLSNKVHLRKFQDLTQLVICQHVWISPEDLDQVLHGSL